MDKQTLMVICNECFDVKGNCAYLHFVDGSNLLIKDKPQFFSVHMQVRNTYELNLKEINELICIPYSSVIYVTLTTIENINAVNDYYHGKAPVIEE